MGPPGVRLYCQACPCDIVILKAESAMKHERSVKGRRAAPGQLKPEILMASRPATYRTKEPAPCVRENEG